MPFRLPDLPYRHDALEPHLSRETLEYHHGKHHAGYVRKLNKALEERGESERDQRLEDLLHESSGAVFQNAAQAWNHTFYWNSMSPDGGGHPPEQVQSALDDVFGSVDEFKQLFTKTGAEHFGSGWVWLVQTRDGWLEVIATHDADNPLRAERTPLLTCDVWEHAYYIDHRNEKRAFLEAFWNIVNWQQVADHLVWSPEHATGRSER